MTGPTRAVPIAQLNEARRRANAVRGEWLLNVNAGLATPRELIFFATQKEGRPLLKIKLRQLAAAQPHVSLRFADRCLTALLRHVGDSRSTVAGLTVGWLVDPLYRQNDRIDAWMAIFETPSDCPPWAGFPYTTNPAQAPQS